MRYWVTTPSQTSLPGLGGMEKDIAFGKDRSLLRETGSDEAGRSGHSSAQSEDFPWDRFWGHEAFVRKKVLVSAGWLTVGERRTGSSLPVQVVHGNGDLYL